MILSIEFGKILILKMFLKLKKEKLLTVEMLSQLLLPKENLKDGILSTAVKIDSIILHYYLS